MNQNKTLCIFALHRMEFLKTREKLIFYELLETEKDIFLFSQNEVQAVLGRRLKTDRWDPGKYLNTAEKDMKAIIDSGIRFVFFWDPGYPPQLREIYDPPFVLFYRGALPGFITPAVGIVGTRFPTGSARSAAFQMGMELSGLGIDVVSGLANGIDREAHEGSLKGSGRSVAVLGNGIDTVYPVTSRKVAEKILLHNGVIFSEYFPGVLPLKYHFPARNRIISGLSRSVVIIQAPERSGALITADYALEQGRDIYVHKTGLSGIQGEGTRKLSCDGAPVIEYALDILLDWDFGVDSSPLNCDYNMSGCNDYGDDPEYCFHNQEKREHTGNWLARMMEYELAGAVTRYNGEYFRR
ncbi:MAG: DNA-processing protein DprA [Spirochaetales bacterium]|nr:DNA-processing protein DprA [Spirochaetales bacterium]